MAVEVGIDFGTCFSEIGFENGDMMALIPKDEKSALCPSVFYRDQKRMAVGSEAVNCGARRPQFMVEGIKKKLREPMLSLDGEIYEKVGESSLTSPGRWVGVKSGLFAMNEKGMKGGSVSAEYFVFEALDKE